MDSHIKEKFGEYKLGGRLKFFKNYWRHLTHSRLILDTISGAKIEFTEEVNQEKEPRKLHFNEREQKFMNNKVKELLENGTLKDVTHDEKNTKWLSNIFLQAKKDGKFRMILDLSLLNLKIKYRKFKMNTIFDVLKMTRRNMSLCSIDIREAYFHLPIFS